MTTFGLVRLAFFSCFTPCVRRQLVNAAGRLASCPPAPPPACAGSLTQLSGLAEPHRADHSLTRYRWDGRDHESTGSNMWSFSTKSLAYVQ